MNREYHIDQTKYINVSRQAVTKLYNLNDTDNSHRMDYQFIKTLLEEVFGKNVLKNGSITGRSAPNSKIHHSKLDEQILNFVKGFPFALY